MKVRKRKENILITLPLLDPPRESKSGKTIVLASSHGPKRTAVRFNGQLAVANACLYIRPEGYVKSSERKSAKPRRLSRRRRKARKTY